jgi:hypothetical protein
VSDASVLWSDPSGEDEEAAEPESQQAGGELDETFATRRLRRWLKGMFGGPSSEEDEPPSETPS